MSVITKDSLPVSQITSSINDSLIRVKMSNSSNKSLLRSTLALSQRLDEKESVLGNERRKINAEKLAAQEQEQEQVVVGDGGYQQGLSEGFVSGFSLGIKKGVEVGKNSIFDQISKIPGLKDFLDSRKPKKMNVGGVVPGYGDQDTVPTMLTPGEFVVRKEVVEKVGVDNLKAVNDMDNKITPMDISEDTDSGTSEILVVNRTNVVTQSVVNNSGGGVVPVPIPIPVGGQNDFISYVKSIS